MEQKTYGFLHCHSEHSLKDSPLSIDELCKTAFEMGAKHLSLTDHGTCTGIIQFLDTCKKYGLNGIPGVELYLQTKYSDQSHLVLLAKNYQGYQEISRIVTESNKNIRIVTESNKNITIVESTPMPITTKEILRKYCTGKNIIALSGGIQGVLSSVYQTNDSVKKEIKETQLKTTQLKGFDKKSYEQLIRQLNETESEINNLVIQEKDLLKIAEKKYKKKLEGLKTLKEIDYAGFLEAEKKINAEIEESNLAKEKLQDVKKQLKTKRTNKTKIAAKIKEISKTKEKYDKFENKISELETHLIPEDILQNHALCELNEYMEIFGSNFYIEIQNHGLSMEKEIMPQLVALAKKTQVPLVATNDVHIKNKDQATARACLKALRFEKWSEIEPSDTELYMKTDKELYQAICEIVDEDSAKESILNIRRICNQCQVIIPEISHYPKYRNEYGMEVEDSAVELRKKTIEGISKKFPNNTFNETYQKRMEYELEVIISLGYADYLLIVADFLNFADNLSKTNNEWNVGYGVGPGRGSGCGSLVNYLLGITQLDPIKYGLLFERFLNKDRVSMPDIDSDFSNEVRNDTIEYVKKKYGENSVAFIRTALTQGAKKAIRDSARILGWQQIPGKNTDENIKKQRKVYQNAGDMIAKAIPEVSGIKIKECESELAPFLPKKIESTIINQAKTIEGNIHSLGIHAAGIIIGDGKPLSDYIPLLYNEKKQQWAVQCDMIEAERIHLLKMDFLALTNLDVITECIRNVKTKYGITIDCNQIPFEKEVFSDIFSKGKTSCVFQFESAGMKNMLKEFGPESFEDLILLVAAYRPGPMAFIPDIIAVKKGKKKPKYIVPELEGILNVTYGQPIYQEQLMEIFRKCAGFSLGEADIIRRYMSKKKVDKFLSYKPQFINGVMNIGASEEGAVQLWESLIDFAHYGFNKSHAAAYAFVSYITAWLKYHFPEEYMCACLVYAETKKIPSLLHECLEMGIKIIPPDINRSHTKFITNDEGNIIYGMSAIKNINNHANIIIQERDKNGNYQSFFDFFIRIHENKGVTESLIKAGAFDKCDNYSRTQLLYKLEDYTKEIKTLRKKTNLLIEEKKQISLCTSKKDIELSQRKIESLEQSIERIKIRLLTIDDMNCFMEDKIQNLKDEYEILGAFVSGHPLDSYQMEYMNKNISYIEDMEHKKTQTFIGMISNLRYANRKEDGAKMAFFTLIDPTGEMNVKCFAESYGHYKHLIKDGEIIKIIGKCEIVSSYFDENEKIKEITVKHIYKCHPEREPVFVSVKNLELYKTEIRSKLLVMEDEDGYPVYLHDSETGCIYEETFHVSSDVLELEIENTYIRNLKQNLPEKVKILLKES